MRSEVAFGDAKTFFKTRDLLKYPFAAGLLGEFIDAGEFGLAG